MKAIVFERYGPPEVLQLKDVPKPVPGDDEVLIRIHATTVVAGDCEFRSFRFPLWFWLPLRVYTGLTRPKRIKILGQELAGEIESVGRNVKRFQNGDQVFAATEIGLGTYAQYKCMREDKPIAIMPANMNYEEAAAVPTGGLNALHYLRKGKLQSGERILINGAAGNIGSFAVQLARHFGADVTAVDSASKLEMLSSIGANHVIDYTKQDFTRSGESWDVILDVIGKSSYSRCIKSLSNGGRYLLANPRVIPMLRAFWTSATSSKKVLFEIAGYRSEDMIFLRELIEQGVLISVIDRNFPLVEMAAAHRYVDSGEKTGNVTITVEHDDQ